MLESLEHRTTTPTVRGSSWSTHALSQTRAMVMTHRASGAPVPTEGPVMKRSLTVVATSMLLAAGTVAVAPSASAEERVCRGSLGATAVDNVRVPQNATCTLSGTTVKGTLKVENGATLRARSIRVVGNIQAEGHRSVVLSSARVGGSLQLEQGAAATLDGNRVTGDVQSFTNRGAQRFTSNVVDGNLQCKENVPAPTGSDNRVDGNKEDQCSRL